jgi:dTDP-glucose 4,6-dehydratase
MQMTEYSWVIVAGGAGFLGCHLTRGLLATGRNVICLDDISTGRWENLDGLSSDRVLRVEHDVRVPSVEVIKRILPHGGVISAVCNFASPASPPAYLLRPIDTLEVGSIGTQNLIELALAHNARFLQASTSEIYGDPLQHPQTEQYWGNVNSIGPRSCYDEAKRYGEAICAAYEGARGLDLRMVRIFNTYGPRMQADDGRVVTNFINQALNGQPITLYGTGEQTRSFCFVDDLISGLILLLDSDVRGPVNLGNPTEFTMIELAQLVCAQTGSASPTVFHDLPTDDPTQRKPDITRAAQLLGWTPKIELAEGLQQTIAWFKC